MAAFGVLGDNKFKEFLDKRFIQDIPEAKMLREFNFEVDESFSLEKIVKAAIFNPLREKHTIFSIFNEKFQLEKSYDDENGAERLIKYF